MFTKLARFRLFGGGGAQQAQPTIGHRSDDGGNRLVRTPRPARRPTLVCRWRNAPSTGALECVWQSVQMPIAGRPRPMRLIAGTASPVETLAAGEPPLLRPAA
jgi:hypothetical protein